MAVLAFPTGGTARAQFGGMRRFLLLLPLLGLACGTEPSTEPADAEVLADAGPKEAGPGDGGDQDAEPPPPCLLDPLPEALSVSEGGRLRLSPRAAWGTEAPVVAVPEGWRLSQVDAESRIRVPYGVDGDFSVSVTVRCAEQEASATIPVRVRRLGFVATPAWQGGVTGPSAREHPALFLDPSRPDRLFLFGGYAFVPRQYTLVTDLWAYALDTGTWTSVTASAAPGRAGGRAISVPSRGEALYAGGSDADGNAVLAFDRFQVEASGPAWAPLPAQTGPGVLETQLGSLAWDAPRQRYVTACGITTNAPHCQVASLDPSTGDYQVLEPSNLLEDRPSPRYGFFPAHDEENQRLVIFSGAQVPRGRDIVNPAQDTWALELAESPVRWVKVLDADPEVPGRRNGCSAYDPIGQRFFVWGGTPDARTTASGLYVLDLERGQEHFEKLDLPPPLAERSSCSAVYDPGRQRILFGFGNNSVGIYADFVALEL